MNSLYIAYKKHIAALYRMDKKRTFVHNNINVINASV